MNNNRLACTSTACSSLVLLLCGVLTCSSSMAAQPLPAGTLPVQSANWVGSGSATASYAPNQLTINQATQKAILNWQSFNIANGSSVNFVQPGASAIALNRIYDQSPSMIQGALSANGQVYLINHNGILFDKGAQVNVGTLVASTLDIGDDVFNKGIGAITDGSPVFMGGSVPDGLIRVEAGAQLNALTGGKIMLFAPKVENNGVITTPDGQTILAAGSKVYLAPSPDTDPGLRGLLVEVDNGGSVSNQNLGQILAQRGNVTLAGLAVNQAGRVSATTSVNANGSIRLLARDTVQAVTTSSDGSGNKTVTATHTGTVTLGQNSVTEVTPELGDKTTSPDEQQFTPSRVEVMGGTIQMQSGSSILAPGGQVSLTALSNPSSPQLAIPGSAANASRVYLDSNSLIDVSGTQNVAVPIERNLVQVDLYGDVLKDSPLIQQSALRGKTITVDIAKGTPLGDYSGYEARIGRTVAERTAVGGTVTVKSEGDVVVRTDATVNLSGGSLKFNDGFINTTKLVWQGKIVDISEATPDKVYDMNTGIAGVITRNHEKWGISETWSSPLVAASRGQFTPGYMEGKDAGTLQFIAPAMVMQGAVIGKTTAGLYQRQSYSVDLASAPYKTLRNMLPKGATLIVGDASQASENSPDFRTGAVNFVAQLTPLPNGFDANAALPSGQGNPVELSTGLVGKDAVSNFAVYSNEMISLPAGQTLSAPGSSVTLQGREIDVAGNIDVQSGTISLRTRAIFGQPQNSSNDLSVGGSLNASGGWINDYLALRTDGAATDPLLIKGGSIDIKSFGDVHLQTGSSLDVSGGGWADSSGKLAGKGDAGSISISSGVGQPAESLNPTTLTMHATLAGYALGKGGSLALSTGRVKLGDSGMANELVLSSDFFNQGGFAKYSVNGIDALTVDAGQTIQVNPRNLQLSPVYRTIASGRSLAGFSQQVMLPEPLRKPGSLSLSASSVFFGNLSVQQGAKLAVDAGGSVNLSAGRQMTVDGTISAPAGSINLAMSGTPGSGSDLSIGFLPDQSIWLGQHAQLLSQGVDQTLVNNSNLRQGEIHNGGQVNIQANKGYVIAEAGSLIDVSGTSGGVDLLTGTGLDARYQRTQVASDAGSINIQTREGAMLNGTLSAKAGGIGAQGGSFSLKVDTDNNLAPNLGGTPYPASERQVVVAQHVGTLPSGLKPGDAIDTASYNGKARISADQLAAGGFDQISLRAQHAVQFDGNVNLQTGCSIVLDAPSIGTNNGAAVNLQSGYVAIGNSNPNYQTIAAVQGGTGSLNAKAGLIDLTGKVALNGFAQTSLNSSGDIRLRGVWNQDPAHLAMTGALRTGGELNLQARQIYPTTLSDFTLAIDNNPSGTIHVTASGTDSPVLSAGGKLTLNAPNIVQAGVLKAPLGQINLSADKSLTLVANSITSVAAQGQTIPFGMTSNGKEWLYALDASTNLSITTPPEKRMTLAGADVAIQNGAKVDISGGGDLYGYEFIPGPPGRSVDILAPSYSTTSFAILPGMRSAYAPYDTQYYQGSAVKPGDSIYLSGANGLPAGVYPLLPARYALLPGAYLVQTVNGYRDMQPQQKVTLADGSQIVAGYRTVADQANAAACFSGFSVRPGAALLKEAEYQQSYASTFFAQQAVANGTSMPRLPADAGQLVLAPHNSLAIQGNPLSAAHDGGRGAVVDVDANLLYIGNLAAPSGFVQLDAATLNNLNAESLLLGGTRQSQTDGVAINVASQQIVVDNSTSAPLQAPEIILAAKDRITLTSGSVVEAAGSAAPAQELIVGRGGNGDGALLRVAAGDHVEVKRENVQRVAGTLDVGSNVLLSGKSIILDATLDTTSHANLQLSGGSLSLGAGRISLGDISGVSGGLLFSAAQLGALGSLDGLYLKSYSTIDFYGDVSLGGAASAIQHLALDAGGLRGFGNAGNTVTLAAGDVALHNSGAANTDAAGTAGGVLNVQVQRSIDLAEGSQHLSGFASTNLVAGEEIKGRASGALQVEGDLNLRAARVTADSGADQNWNASGNVVVGPSVAAPSQPAPIGGKLAISGQRVLNQGTIELAAGTLALTATGTGASDDVTLAASSTTRAVGVAKAIGGVAVFAPGGQIKLASANGNVDIQGGAKVDVSGAAGGGDAGSVQATATNGQMLVNGEMKGGASNGARQGSYTQDTKTLASFSALNTTLEAGQFNQARAIRVRQGNVSVDATDTVHAQSFTLSGDAGKVDVSGQVDASDSKGGQIAIAARDDVTLHGGGILKATGATGKGGQVELSTTAGVLTVENGAQVNVAGVSGNASVDGGEVVLRAPRTDVKDVTINLAGGTINGARETIAEGVKVYGNVSSIGTTTASGKLNINTVKTDTTNYLANAAAVESRLGNNAQLRAGIEVHSSGDLTLANDWDLSSWHVGGRPVMLTLRAAGDLNLSGSLSDGFSNATTTGTLGSGASAWYRLVSGADMAAANAKANQSLAALTSGKGNLNLASSKLVRTGAGNISMATGRNVVLGNDGSVVYTAGEMADAVANFAAPTSSNYAKNGGNLSINAQGDIQGTASSQLITEWLYRQGQLNSNGTFKKNPAWWLRYDQFKQGVGALGGGDVTIAAGGNVSNLDAVVPTNGRVAGTSTSDAVVNLQGGGDLSVRAGGDICSGVYYLAQGHGELTAGGGIVAGRTNTDGTPIHTVLAVGDGAFKLTANRDVQLETVMNPTVFAQGASQKIASVGSSALQKSYFFTYSPNSGVQLNSLAGNVVLANDIVALGTLGKVLPTSLNSVNSNFKNLLNDSINSLYIYPSSLTASAMQGDIRVNKKFTLFPSAQGGLQLLAANNVRIGGTVNLSDADPGKLPGILNPSDSYGTAGFNNMLLDKLYSSAYGAHAAVPVHDNDTVPVRVVAQSGDVTSENDAALVLAKAAQISAGRDVVDINLHGQNVNASDVTSIQAGRDITYVDPRDASGKLLSNSRMIQLDGPGRLALSAGRNIDLGNSFGVVTMGNMNNPALADQGADIAVTVGVKGALDYAGFAAKYGLNGVTGYTPELAQTFFGQLMLAGKEHNDGKDGIKDGNGQIMGYQRGYDAIATLFPGSYYQGDLNLFFSQIKTFLGGNIDLFVPGGKINAGLASVPGDLISTKADSGLATDTASLASKIGVVTMKGGSVHAVARDDFLVNSSRVFTLQGGDIVLWSSQGNIDAGKGAKTALAVPPPIIRTKADGSTEVEYQGAATGSGIRVLLSGNATPGEVDLIAPKGEVNAGDAGIGSAGNINIAAARVVGAQNINFSGVSSGVPVAQTSSLAAGLTGVSGMAADAGKAGSEAAQAMAQAKPQDSFRPAYLNVEVIGFGE